MFSLNLKKHKIFINLIGRYASMIQRPLMVIMNDMLLIIDELTNNFEVIYDIYSKKWLEAMDFMY
jgi:hypothetical protein